MQEQVHDSKIKVQEQVQEVQQEVQEQVQEVHGSKSKVQEQVQGFRSGSGTVRPDVCHDTGLPAPGVDLSPLPARQAGRSDVASSGQVVLPQCSLQQRCLAVLHGSAVTVLQLQ